MDQLVILGSLGNKVNTVHKVPLDLRVPLGLKVSLALQARTANREARVQQEDPGPQVRKEILATQDHLDSSLVLPDLQDRLDRQAPQALREPLEQVVLLDLRVLRVQPDLTALQELLVQRAHRDQLVALDIKVHLDNPDHLDHRDLLDQLVVQVDEEEQVQQVRVEQQVGQVSQVQVEQEDLLGRLDHLVHQVFRVVQVQPGSPDLQDLNQALPDQLVPQAQQDYRERLVQLERLDPKAVKGQVELQEH